MNDLMRYAASLEGVIADSLPPVEKWDPPFSGEIDISIDIDGMWFHEGDPIERARLVRLFSTILKREDDDYFLVTPVEKYRIKVSDVPFIGVALNIEHINGEQHINIRSNVGDEILIGPEHPIELHAARAGDSLQLAPYVEVRRRLEARLNRSAYFDLVDVGEVRDVNGKAMFGVMSAGMFFPLSAATEIFGEDTQS